MIIIKFNFNESNEHTLFALEIISYLNARLVLNSNLTHRSPPRHLQTALMHPISHLIFSLKIIN